VQAMDAAGWAQRPARWTPREDDLTEALRVCGARGHAAQVGTVDRVTVVIGAGNAARLACTA
jgi:hypothetical protein